MNIGIYKQGNCNTRVSMQATMYDSTENAARTSHRTLKALYDSKKDAAKALKYQLEKSINARIESLRLLVKENLSKLTQQRQ